MIARNILLSLAATVLLSTSVCEAGCFSKLADFAHYLRYGTVWHEPLASREGWGAIGTKLSVPATMIRVEPNAEPEIFTGELRRTVYSYNIPAALILVNLSFRLAFALAFQYVAGTDPNHILFEPPGNWDMAQMALPFFVAIGNRNQPYRFLDAETNIKHPIKPAKFYDTLRKLLSFYSAFDVMKMGDLSYEPTRLEFTVNDKDEVIAASLFAVPAGYRTLPEVKFDLMANR